VAQRGDQEKDETQKDARRAPAQKSAQRNMGARKKTDFCVGMSFSYGTCTCTYVPYV
jgi:hypothetical protein